MPIKNNQIVVAGNMTIDTLYWVDELPPLDEVAIVRRTSTCLGGRGAIVAGTLSALGVPTGLCTATGPVPAEYLEPFLSVGMRIEGLLETSNEGKAIEILVTIGAKEQDCTSLLIPARGVKMEPSPGQHQAVSAAKFVYYTTHDIAFNRKLLEAESPPDQITIHNLSLSMWSDPDYFRLVCDTATLIVMNRFECTQLIAHLGLADVRQLFESSPRLEGVVVTKGCDGVEVIESNGSSSSVPAQRVDVSTPVGAGDSFSAGMIYGMIRGRPLQDACKLGTKIAALSVGSDTSYPDFDKVQYELQRGAFD